MIPFSVIFSALQCMSLREALLSLGDDDDADRTSICSTESGASPSHCETVARDDADTPLLVDALQALPCGDDYDPDAAYEEHLFGSAETCSPPSHYAVIDGPGENLQLAVAQEPQEDRDDRQLTLCNHCVIPHSHVENIDQWLNVAIHASRCLPDSQVDCTQLMAAQHHTATTKTRCQ